MSIIKIEYQKFLEKEFNNLNEYEKTISNIIWDNLDQIRSNRRANGMRNRVVSELIIQNANKLNTQADFQESEFESDSQLFTALNKLRVESFRGFRHEEEFDLSKNYTFIYGPNGSGKSSFCEALEYSLLGSIAEANKKRINTEDYIRNVDSNRSEFPILTGSYDNEIKEIQPSPSLYEFCFIERNRIEGFSRITANAPSIRQEQLSTLLGLEDFNQFVSEFSSKINNERNTYIDCVGVKAEKLKEKREEIKHVESLIKDLEDEKVKIDEDKAALLNTYTDIETLKKLDEFLNGDDEEEGEIKNIESEILRLSGSDTIKAERIYQAEKDVEELITLIDENKKKGEEVTRFKEDLKLKNLYEAILSSSDDFSELCPACETPIYEKGQLMLVKDPFTNAKSKIQGLTDAIETEEEVDMIKEKIDELLKNLKAYSLEISESAKILGISNQEKLKSLHTSLQYLTKDNIHEDHILYTYQSILSTLKESYINYTSSMTESDKRKASLKEELRKLETDRNTVITLLSEYKSNEAKFKKYTDQIEKFTKDNKSLIEEVEQEKEIVEENIKFVGAYESLIRKLKDYNERLPASLVEDISNLALELYNMINQYDHEYDKLESLNLPTTSDEKISIKFNKGETQDALLVLSEGHLRCLGLSILLAKNIKNGLPLLIFDDVVNAIDDEHRRGIIDTLLSHEGLQDKQIIITTHGAEFMKNLENHIKSDRVPEILQRYNFQRSVDRKEIKVLPDDYKNYLEKAKRFLEVDDYTYCLDVCRKSLEQQVMSIWIKYELKVSFTSTKGNIKEYSLARLTEQVIRALESKIELRNIKNLLVKIRGTEESGNNQKFWNLLNAGVHEEIEREEFDRVDVMNIYKILVHLQSLQEDPQLEDEEINRIID